MPSSRVAEAGREWAVVVRLQARRPTLHQRRHLMSDASSRGTIERATFLPDRAREVLRRLAGSWTVSGSGPAGPITARWTATLPRPAHCLTLHYEGTHGDTPFAGEGLLGWSSAEAHLHYVMFYSNDVHEFAEFAFDDSDQFSGRYYGHAMGIPFRGVASLELELPDRFLFRVSPLAEKRLDAHQQGSCVRFTRSPETEP